MRNGITTLLALIPGLAFGADETYSIKLKLEVSAGRTATYRSSSIQTAGSMKFFSPDGKLLEESKKEGGERVYKVTVFERDKGGKATRYIRVYEKATEMEDGKTKTLSYQGRTVLFERVDGKVRIGVAGEPALDPKDVAKLLKDANKKTDSQALLRNLPPTKPVKVGDSWPVPVKPVAESMEGGIVDESKSSIMAKLVKVYSKDKSQFGTFEIDMTMAITGMSEEGMTFTFDTPGTMRLKQTVDLAIDGSTTERKEVSTAHEKGEGFLKIGDAKLRVVFDTEGKGEDELSDEVYEAKARIVPKVTFATDPNDWTEFKPKDGSFIVKFPGRPTESDQKGDGYTAKVWSVSLEEGILRYDVGVSTSTTAGKLDPKTTLKAVVAKLPGVKTQKEIKVSGYPGVEITYEMEANSISVSVVRQILVVDERLYELAAIALKGKTIESEKFFSSFRLLEVPKKDE